MNLRHLPALLAKFVIVGAALLLLTPTAQAQAQAQEVKKQPRNPVPAQLGDFTLIIQPGLAIPLSAPQSSLYNIGGGQTIKGLWTLNKYLDLGPSLTFIGLPAHNPQAAAGTAWTFGPSLRVKRPHDMPDNDKYYTLSPWMDVEALYVRTGPVNRPGFSAAAGLAMPVGASRTFWLGPFARYLHIFQDDSNGFDDHDAKILSVGVSLEMGSSIKRERQAEAFAAGEDCNECPDRDGDGIPDDIDHCPDVAGPMDNWGCPVYKKIVIKRDKLELREKIQFDWDKATLKEESYPVLDEVVVALNDNKAFRVQVDGHASAEGTDDHNQTLSEQRAEAVLDYLASHGISRDRLVSKGFSSSEPLASNTTEEGRETNRRVEFVVYFIILNDGSN